MENKNKQNLLLVIFMIVIAAATRFFPHPPNLTAVGAMGLFGAAYFNNRMLALIVPFATLWISNLVLNNVFYAEYYDHFVWFDMNSIWVYVGFGLIVLMGMGALNKITLPRVIGASLTASTIFFLVSNFGSWIGTATYTKDFSGLMACYGAGLPFFPNTIIGDLFYCGVLFGIYEFYKSKSSSLVSQTLNA